MNDHDHEHDYGSASAGATKRVNGLIATLEERGITSDAEITEVIEQFLARAGPANGARIRGSSVDGLLFSSAPS